MGGGVVGAGAGAALVPGAGAGAGAGAACFSGGVTGVGAGAGFFSVVVGAGAFFTVDGVSFLQPLNVNATKAKTANAVRTTFLMVNPFRKTISLNTPPKLRRAKTLDAPVNYHHRFRKATCTRHSITAKPEKDQDKNP